MQETAQPIISGTEGVPEGSMAWQGIRGGGEAEASPPCGCSLPPAVPLCPSRLGTPPCVPTEGDERWRGRGAFPGPRAHLHANGGCGWNSNGGGGARGHVALTPPQSGALQHHPLPTAPSGCRGRRGPLLGEPPKSDIPPVPPVSLQPLRTPPCPGTPTSAQGVPPTPGVPPRVPPPSPTRSLGSWARTAKVASWRHWHLVCAGRVSRVWQLSVSQFPKPGSLINGTRERGRASNLK